jgi:hypothetical protein
MVQFKWSRKRCPGLRPPRDVGQAMLDRCCPILSVLV